MRHEIGSSVGDTAGITQDVAQDPTVGLSQSLSETSLSDLPGFCTMCGQEVFCVICGQETEGGVFLEAEDDGTGTCPISFSSSGQVQKPKQEHDKHSSKS
jgi:DNA-directed RNA polymerase II subunit RPB9